MWWLVLTACVTAEDPQSWEWDLPEDFPVPAVPDDNPMTRAKVELGRHLFHDTQLSANQTQSCSTCHLQELAFTDGLAQGLGSTGETHPRGPMSLANAGYASTYNWANNVVRTLEDQALVPLFGEFPVELGMSGQEDVLLDRLAADPLYQELFPLAYPDASDPWTLSGTVDAIASYERALISADSAYDRLAYGGEWDAMTDEELLGMQLFFSEDLECFHCHGGFTFSDSSTHDADAFDETPFHNNGLYNIDGEGGYPEDNRGLYELTGEPSDMGRFKAPTLRNIAVTAPYMHDGSIETLEEVLAHYAAGGRTITEGEYAGDGSQNPNKSPFVNGFSISEAETAAVIAFLEALTDQSLLDDTGLGDPFN